MPARTRWKSPVPERGPHGLQPVVAVVAAAELDPQRAEGDVELVVDGDDVRRVDLVERGERLDRAAGLVHVAAAAGEHDAGPAQGQPALDDVGATRLVGAERRSHPGGQLVGDEVADVVPVPGVGRTGVAETDDQPHVGRRSSASRVILPSVDRALRSTPKCATSGRFLHAYVRRKRPVERCHWREDAPRSITRSRCPRPRSRRPRPWPRSGRRRSRRRRRRARCRRRPRPPPARPRGPRRRSARSR